MSKKTTFDYVKASFECEGYTLVSDTHVNNTIKLRYVCTMGHSHEVSWSKWLGGVRCPICSTNNRAKSRRLSFDTIKSSFNEHSYSLLSTECEYENVKTKLNYVCPEGHKGKITWHDWKGGCRCSICGNIASAWKRTIPFSQVETSFKNQNYILLSKTYKNAHSKLDYICPNGHIKSIAWSDWSQGRRCPVCAYIEKSGHNHYNWKGGISFEPYCEAWKCKEYKQDIRDRDGNKCLNPYCDSSDANDLTIHHIDYDKKNCKPNNLITVCRSCNSKANKDRDWHKSWYQSIIMRRGVK